MSRISNIRCKKIEKKLFMFKFLHVSRLFQGDISPRGTARLCGLSSLEETQNIFSGKNPFLTSKSASQRARRKCPKVKKVEPELVEFWVSWANWSYAQIIFPAGFTSQGGFNKDATMAEWSLYTPKYIFYLFEELKIWPFVSLRKKNMWQVTITNEDGSVLLAFSLR